MNTRRVFLQPDEILELVEPNGLSALKARVFTDKLGEVHVFIWPQPCVEAHFDLRQDEIDEVLFDRD